MLDLIRDWFQGAVQGPSTPPDEPTRSLSDIQALLEGMAPSRARFLACYAYLMTCVVASDGHQDAEEVRVVEEILRDVGQMSLEQARLVGQMASEKQAVFGATDDFRVIQAFAALADLDDKLRLLECLFAVAAADKSVRLVEEEAIRQISLGLGVPHRQFIQVRLKVSQYREVLKD